MTNCQADVVNLMEELHVTQLGSFLMDIYYRIKKKDQSHL